MVAASLWAFLLRVCLLSETSRSFWTFEQFLLVLVSTPRLYYIKNDELATTLTRHMLHSPFPACRVWGALTDVSNTTQVFNYVILLVYWDFCRFLLRILAGVPVGARKRRKKRHTRYKSNAKSSIAGKFGLSIQTSQTVGSRSYFYSFCYKCKIPAQRS